MDDGREEAGIRGVELRFQKERRDPREFQACRPWQTLVPVRSRATSRHLLLLNIHLKTRLATSPLPNAATAATRYATLQLEKACIGRWRCRWKVSPVMNNAFQMRPPTTSTEYQIKSLQLMARKTTLR